MDGGKTQNMARGAETNEENQHSGSRRHIYLS